MPGFDDAGTGFDDPVSFDAAGTGGGGSPVFTVEGWGGISLSVEVAFTVDEFIIGESLIGITNLGPNPVWTDITEFVMSWNSKRGRQRALERFATGTLHVDLLNTDGRSIRRTSPAPTSLTDKPRSSLAAGSGSASNTLRSPIRRGTATSTHGPAVGKRHPTIKAQHSPP